MLNGIDTSKHPDASQGFQSPRDVLENMKAFFQLSSSSDVSRDTFLEYYDNVSAWIEDDNTFVSSLKASWSLSDRLPAPPMPVVHNTYGINSTEDVPHTIFRNRVSNTVISSGDIVTWTQEPSQFESMGVPKGQTKKVSCLL